jgi:hypothetical protein
MEWYQVYSKQLKLVAAGLGTGAVLAMGGLTVAVGDVSAAGIDPVPAAPELTTGETATETTAPKAPETSVAVPPITTPPYTIPTGEPQ